MFETALEVWIAAGGVVVAALVAVAGVSFSRKSAKGVGVPATALAQHERTGVAIKRTKHQFRRHLSLSASASLVAVMALAAGCTSAGPDTVGPETTQIEVEETAAATPSGDPALVTPCFTVGPETRLAAGLDCL